MGIWDLIAVQPMINILIALSSYVLNNLGISIIILTIVVNGLMLGLTLKQVRSSKAMQDLQPKLAELQKKFGKDRQRMAQEQMRLYKESGMTPAGCLVPMLIQMPIWIALYQSIMRLLAVIPENFLGLANYLYSWPIVYSTLPLENNFLWMNLATGDMVLALLVGGSMWVQQKMVMAKTTDPKQKSQSQMMLWMMPMMFAFLSLSFPSGLALFWATSSIFRIVVQYFTAGWGGLVGEASQVRVVRDSKYKKRITQVEKRSLNEADVSADIVVEPSFVEEEGLSYDEESGIQRQDSGGSYSSRLRDIRRQTGRGGGHHPKRR